MGLGSDNVIHNTAPYRKVSMKNEKEEELWDKPAKLAKIAIHSSLHEGSSGDWHVPPCKRIRNQQL